MTDKDLMLGAARRLEFNVPVEHEEDYVKLLAKTAKICEQVLNEPDYKPAPRLSQFPRTEVHLPVGDANPLKAWAWRANAGDDLESAGKLLSGKTIVLKDTICMAGVPLLFGTDAFSDYIPDVDATVVTRILEHGGHILGKAACENFSHGATSSSSPFGPVENPFAFGFTTGGSSSGCGGLVGAGVVDMAVGGDQGGSIRIPASYCGIVGLKPTFGLVPYTGVLSSDAGLDHVGPMARTCLDAARLLQAIAGYDDIDDRQLGAPRPVDLPDYLAALTKTSLAGVKIGILKEALEAKLLDKSVEKLFLAAAERFKALGAELVEISVPTFSLSPSLSHICNKLASGGTRQGRAVGRRGLYLNDYWEQLLPWTQDKYDKAKYFVTGTAMSCEYAWANYPTVYGRAMNLTRRLRDEFDTALAKVDVIILPTCPTPPRRHIPAGSGPLAWAEHAPGASSFTAAANLSGHPALTVPCGFAPPVAEDVISELDKSVKLPVGFTIMGGYQQEATLLRVGHAWEQSVDWKSVVL